MKKLLTIATALIILALPALAAEKAAPGPNGGRLLAFDGGKSEFFVEPDRKITVTFFDDALKKIAPAGQVVSATADAPSGKAKLEFQPKGDILESTTALPAGDGYVIVVQIRPSADAKPKNFRITYLSHKCGECGLAEYACVCSH